MKKYILLCVAFIAFFSSSCSEFLDVPQPDNVTSATGFFDNPESLVKLMRGVYGRLNTMRGSQGSTSFFSALLAHSLRGRDIAWAQGQWYIDDYTYFPSRSTSTRGNTNWSNFYSMIDQCNLLIDRGTKVTLAGIPTTDDAARAPVQDVISQAHAMRGFLYFMLLFDFSLPYLGPNGNMGSNNGSSPGVPLYTTPSTATRDGSVRGTVDDVKMQILDDLSDEKIGGLDANIDPTKIEITRRVAHGMRARIKLYFGDYPGALADARVARGTGAASMPSSSIYTQQFTSSSNSEWMWIVGSNDDQTFGFGNPIFYIGEKGRIIEASIPTAGLKSLFGTADIRGKALKGFPDTPTSTKFRSLGFAQPLLIMRVSEMILIQAECEARGGMNSVALATLNALQTARMATPTPSSNVMSSEALVDTILVERRKELYYEGFDDYYSLRRLNTGMTRSTTTGNHIALVANILSYPSNSPCYTYLIPSAEIDENPKIKEKDQNPDCVRTQ